jgi:hypothetical protein
MKLDRLHLEVDLFRQQEDLKNVLVCFAIDYHSEQRHLLQSTTVPVSSISIKECLTKIISRLVEGSVFNDASPPGTAETLSAQQQALSSATRIA